MNNSHNRVFVFRAFHALFPEYYSFFGHCQSMIDTILHPWKLWKNNYRLIASRKISGIWLSCFMVIGATVFVSSHASAQVGLISPKLIDSLIRDSGIDSLYHFEQSKIAQRALELSESIQYKKGILESSASLARVDMNLGQYERAIQQYQKVLQLAEEVDSVRHQAYAKYSLGNIYQKLKQFNNALKNFEESLKIFEQLNDKKWVGILYNGIGIVYLQLDEKEKGTAMLTNSLNIFLENGLEPLTGMPISNLAQQYFDEKQYEIALQYYQKSLNISKKSADVKSEAIQLANIGLVMREMKQFDLSIDYTKQALAIAEEYQFNKLVVDFSKDLAETYKETRQFQQAVVYYEKFNTLSDSLLNDRVKQQVDKLQIAYENERKEKESIAREQEIMTLKQEKQLSFLINIGILALVLFSGFAIWMLFSKNKTKRQLMESELKNKEIEKDRLKQQLTFREQDLTNFALDISRKNDFAHRLHDRLEALMKSDPKEIKEKARKLYFSVANHLKINDDFKEFQMNVDTVNQDFYHKLDDQFPDLTMNEKQLCGLIRLNLTTKDIAAIKNISPKSVEMGRYRLRKKMKLEQGTEIGEFLLKL